MVDRPTLQMGIEVYFMSITGLALAIGGWFFKRIFCLLDKGQERMNMLEVDVASLNAKVQDTHDRLDRIEEKIDRLPERRLK